jgi:hypothetical protein
MAAPPLTAKAVMEANAFAGQALLDPEHVFIRYAAQRAGGGTTPGGLLVEHSQGAYRWNGRYLPPMFGTIVAAGPLAMRNGLRPGQEVFFCRYAGEEIDTHPDNLTFAIFHMEDVWVHIPPTEIPCEQPVSAVL